MSDSVPGFSSGLDYEKQCAQIVPTIFGLVRMHGSGRKKRMLRRMIIRCLAYARLTHAHLRLGRHLPCPTVFLAVVDLLDETGMDREL